MRISQHGERLTNVHLCDIDVRQSMLPGRGSVDFAGWARPSGDGLRGTGNLESVPGEFGDWRGDGKAAAT